MKTMIFSIAILLGLWLSPASAQKPRELKEVRGMQVSPLIHSWNAVRPIVIKDVTPMFGYPKIYGRENFILTGYDLKFGKLLGKSVNNANEALIKPFNR